MSFIWRLTTCKCHEFLVCNNKMRSLGIHTTFITLQRIHKWFSKISTIICRWWCYILLTGFATGSSLFPLRWRYNKRDGVSNHQHHDCLRNRLFGRRSKETSKLCVTGLCVGNSLVTGEFPAQRASNAENVFIWWRHHALQVGLLRYKNGSETVWSKQIRASSKQLFLASRLRLKLFFRY